MTRTAVRRGLSAIRGGRLPAAGGPWPVAGCQLPAAARPLLVVLALWVAGISAEPSASIYAIQGARIVPGSGSPIDNGTIVFRDGVIVEVGPKASVPPGALVIAGKGLTVYPGLIDMGSAAGLSVPPAPRAESPQTTEEVERAKLDALLRAHVRAADHVDPGAHMLARMAAAGITSVLATPAGDAIRGHSAFTHTVLPADDPQVGALADERRPALVLKPFVALHVNFPERPSGGNAYPQSLMGAISFVRQHFLDAQHYQQALQQVERAKRTALTPSYRAAYEAMGPALAAQLPVAFQAETSREILRALAMAQQFKLDPIVTRAREADQVVGDLKAANARVLYSLNYPTRPSALAPDADEPLRVLRSRANAPKAPAALDKAGVLFAFESDGLSDPRDFLKNAAKAVQNGLSREAALKALTLNAATIAGLADRVGTLDAGKLANILVTEGDLFGDKTTIKHVFVAGHPARLDVPAEPPRPPGQPGGARASGLR